ncbi:MAG TPA: ABC transporter substrate-binding protein [Blastocatellia bacterium]|nr:ABC transporter substrate-binding protein [Blastocatellia bacterium]
MNTRSAGRPGVVETAHRCGPLWRSPFGNDLASATVSRRYAPSSIFKSPLILLLAAILLASSTACRRGRTPGTLVIAIEAPPPGFDPRFSSTDGISARVMQLIYDTLLVKREDFEFAPSLAERFEESEDHTTFTFHLRSGVMFHNGKPLTSADVKYTFDSLVALKSPIRGLLDKISSIEAPDPATVVFKAREPYYTFIGNLPVIGIIPQDAGLEMGNSPVGSGPYRFVSYSEGDGVRLEANNDYWKGPPVISRIHIRVVGDNSTRQAELMSGAVDLAYNAQFDPETIRALQNRHGMQVVIGEGTNIDYLGLNLSPASKLSNQKVRQAIAYAIEPEVIIHRLLRDQARQADAIMPPEHWAYDKNVTVYQHDPERSKLLLDEAGYADADGDGAEPRLTLRLMTSTAQLSRNIGSILQEQLRGVGIRLELESLERATLFDRINKSQFDLYYLRSIGANQSTDIFQFVYHSRYQDPEFNDAIARLRAVSDRSQMRPLLDKIASILERKEYCTNAEVESLARMAQHASPAETQRQYYLQIAGVLTERGGQNRMRYCNPRVDEWINAADRVNDRAAKIEFYSKIQETVSEDLPQIYLWYSANVLVARSRVRNIQIEPTGSWFFITKLTLED